MAFIIAVGGMGASRHVRAASVAAGGDFSCAVVNQGVQCWGGNDYGQLGNPAFSDVDSATDVATLQPGVGAAVSDISAGYSHACAVAHGTLQCWGYNGFGAVGVAGTGLYVEAPLAVSGLVGVKAVAAGTNFTCAIAKDANSANDAVYCWGRNHLGQLGLNDTNDRSVPTVPTLVLSGAGAISAGQNHACAIDATAVYCWGSNASGQLGLGNKQACNVNSTCLTPQTLLLGAASSVAAGDDHTCIVTKSQGAVYCWGGNNYGQLGQNNRTSSDGPLLVASLNAGVASVAAGGNETCAVVTNGVKCWGQGDGGQQGNFSVNDALTPHDVQSLTPGAPGTTEVAVGIQHACAWYAAKLQCWGEEGHGQLGLGSDARQLSLATVAGLTSIVQIAAGGGHTCSRSSLGNIDCWGKNNSGQVGDGSTVNRLNHKTVIVGNATAISVGDDHSCAIVHDPATNPPQDNIWCWGSGGYGKLGSGNTNNALSPQKILSFSKVSTVAAGYAHTCAIQGVNEDVYCWGNNQSGQLGFDNNGMQVMLPALVAGLSGATSLALGGYHTCALVGGNVWCWGNNDFGQVGQSDLSHPYLSPTKIPNLSGVLSIVAGYDHTCAKLNTGEVRCWGYGAYGQLGLGSYTGTSSPTVVPNLNGPLGLSAGIWHTCAVESSGQVSCWGKGDDGQLGNAFLDDRLSPTKATGPLIALAVSAGYTHSCAIKGDGTVTCWGDALYGKLGNGDNGLKTYPGFVVNNDTIFGNRFETRPGPGP